MTAEDRFLIEFRNGASGLRERVRILRYGWTGGVVQLDAPPDPFTLTYTFDDPFDPLPTSEAVLRVFGQSADRRGFVSVLAEIQGTADGTYPVVWETEETLDSGTYQTRWVGFLTQQDYTDHPFADVGGVPAVLSVKARDGIDLLNYRSYDPGAGEAVSGFVTYNLAAQIARQIAEATPEADAASPTGTGTGRGLLTGIDFLMNWRPWLPGEATPIGPTETPVAHLFVRGSGTTPFVSENAAESTRLEALRQFLGRFGLSLIQSRGRWLAVQLSEYRPDGSDEIDVARYETPDDAPDIAALDDGTTTTLTPVIDSRGPTADIADGAALSFVGFGAGSPARSLLAPTREVVSIYDFDPQLDQILSNGSFEDEGATAVDAEYWTTPGAERVELTAATSLFDPSANDRYGLEIEYTDSIDDTLAAEQTSGFFVVGGPRVSLSFGFDVSFTWDVDIANPRCKVWVEGKTTTWYLTKNTVDPVASALGGNGARVRINALLTGGGNVTGTLVIPEGTKLRFFDDTANVFIDLVLTEGAEVGDTELVGDLSADIDIDNTIIGAPFGTWSTTEGAFFIGQPEWFFTGGTYEDILERIDLGAVMQTPAAVVVTGSPAIGFLRRLRVAPGPTASAPWFVDDAEIAVSTDGTVTTEIAYQAALPTDAFAGGGRSVQLPARSVGGRGWLFGDGPGPNSLGNLTVLRSGTPYYTQQGSDTGWRSGYYLAGVESDERSLDMLQAVEVLKTRGVHLERWQLPVWNQDAGGAPVIIDPENVFRLYRRFRIEATAFAGADYIESYDRVRVGETVDLLSGTDGSTTVVESHTVTAVIGSGPYTIELDGTLSQQYLIGSRFAVARDFFWDRLVQRPGAGVTLYEGTEQYRDDSLVPNEQILQQ